MLNFECRGKGQINEGQGEQAQAVTTGEIINWLTSRYGPNTKEFTPTKIGIAMKKLGYEPSRTNKGKCYIVVRILMPELEQEGKHVAKQILNP